MKGFLGLLVLTSAALTACKSDPGPAQALVTVEKLVERSGQPSCFSPCEGSAAPHEKITVDRRCDDPTPVSCGFVGGVDRLRVVVDYGDTNIESTAGFAGPELRLVGDTTPLIATNLVAGPLILGPQRPYASLVAFAPAKQVVSLVIETQLSGGDIIHAAGSFDIKTSLGSLVLSGCPPPPGICSRAHQVGTQEVVVSVPANLGAQTAVVTPLVDGMPSGVALQIPLTAAPGNILMGAQSLNVPASGQTWSFTGFAGTIALTPAQISLSPPTGTLALPGCPPAPDVCARALQVGTQAVTVTVPRLFNATTAVVTTYVDGVPSLAPLQIPLAPAGEFSTGTQFVNVPSSGQLWTFKGVAGSLTLPQAQIALKSATGAISLPGCPAPPLVCSRQHQVGTQAVTVTVPADLSAQTAVVTTLVDGIPAATNVQVALFPGPGNVLTGTQFVNVPANGEIWTFTGSASGLSLAPAQIALIPAIGSLTLAGCPAPPAVCTRQLQVGTQAVTVTVPGKLNVQAATISHSIDGTPAMANLVVPLSPAPGDLLTGTQFLSVPVSGQTWTFTGTAGSLRLPAAQIALVPPTLSLAIDGCAAPCTLVGGSTATLTLSAPAETQVTTASITSRLNGNLVTGVQSVNLAPCPNGVQCVSFPLVVPNQPGQTWQVSARVGAFQASSMIATISM